MAITHILPDDILANSIDKINLNFDTLQNITVVEEEKINLFKDHIEQYG